MKERPDKDKRKLNSKIRKSFSQFKSGVLCLMVQIATARKVPDEVLGSQGVIRAVEEESRHI